MLLDSKIITNAIINVLEGRGDLLQLEMLVIPAGIQWLIYDLEGNVVGGELQNILLALNAVSGIIAQVDFDNLSPQDIGLLTDEAIDALFESEILVASLSDYLLTAQLGNFTLIIPDSAYDETTGYIKKTEFSYAAKALKLAVDTLLCAEDDDTCGELGIDIGNAFSMTGDDLDTLLLSDILAATLGNIVIEMAPEMLVIPASALDPDVFVDEVPVEVISRQEIKDVFSAISLLGIEDFENFAFSADILVNLEDAEAPGELDESKLDTLFASTILRATIAKFLLDMLSRKMR